MKWTVFKAALLLAAVTQPISGQQPPHPPGQPQARAPGMMQMMDMGGMMLAMHAGLPGPAMLLGAADVLGLSDDQEDRLRALAQSAGQEHQQHAQAAMAAHQRAESALGGESPDLEAYAAALREASNHTVLAHVAMARSAVDARAVLTPEQREKLAETARLLRGMHQGMEQGHPR